MSWDKVIKAIGPQQAEALRQELAGEVLKVPKRPCNAGKILIVQKMLVEMSYREVAKETSLPLSTVYRYSQKQLP